MVVKAILRASINILNVEQQLQQQTGVKHKNLIMKSTNVTKSSAIAPTKARDLCHKAKDQVYKKALHGNNLAKHAPRTRSVHIIDSVDSGIGKDTSLTATKFTVTVIIIGGNTWLVLKSLTTAKEASKPKLTAKPDAVPRKRCGNTSEIMKNGKVNKPMVEKMMCITIHMAGSTETLAKALGYQPDKANNSIHTVIPEAENMPAGLRPQRSNKELINKVVIIRATPTITAQRKGSVDTPAAVAICTANTTTTTIPEHC
uniref:Uncharacterized protein n=1 Tax=Glossina austeni TaxID=7395 RepID=A0A1A9VQ00_GLOAU